MRTPRGWSGGELIKRLGHLGYVPTRQSGSHVRLTRADDGGDHHLTVPLHDPVRIGTLTPFCVMLPLDWTSPGKRCWIK